MRTIQICFGEADARRRRMKQGENLAVVLTVDVRSILAHWPGAWFTLLTRRPDGVVYPAALMLNADADGCVRYAMTNVETAIQGEVEIEIQAREDDTLIKSHTFAFEVLPGLSDPGDDIPVVTRLVSGALVVGKDNGSIGSLANGQPGQVLSTDVDGALVWVSVAPGTIGEIPVATGALLGLVRSSEPTLPDSVAVNTDGKMTVNSLNVNKLYVAQQDEWVLNAGGAEPV